MKRDEQHASSIEKLSQTLGLSNNEAQCYIHLLQHQGIPASVLGKRLEMKRSTAKYTLNQLVKHKVATVLEKNGTHLFFPISPEDLSSIFEKEKIEIETKKQEFQKISGDLSALQHTSPHLPKVQFFEGVEGLKKMYWDVIESKQTIYGYSRVDETNVHPEILDFLYHEYIPAREKIGNKSFMIYNGKVNTKYLKNDTKVNRTTLFSPTEEVEFESCFHIYGNKIAFYSRKQNDLVGVLIENKTIRENQFSLFKLAWNFVRRFPENAQYKETSIRFEQ